MVALLSALIGLVAVVGWLNSHPPLVQWNRHLAPIPFNAAWSLVLIGLGMIALNREAFRVAFFCALPVVIYSGTAGMGHIVGISLGISSVSFLPPMVFGHFPAHVAPLSALMLMVVSFSLAFAALTHGRAIGPAAGALLMALGAAGLVGQLTPLWPIWSDLRTTSLPGALAIFAIGLSSLQHGWEEIRGRRLGLAFLTGTIFIAITLVLASALRTYEHTELRRASEGVWRGVADQMREQTRRPLAIARLAERWEAVGIPPKAACLKEAALLVKGVRGLRAVIRVAPSTQVLWRAPRSGRGQVVGRFLSADPERALALARARMSNKPVMTPAIPLFRGGEGFVVVAPLRVAGHFAGYVAGIFDTRSLFSHFVGNLWQGFHVTVAIHHVRFFERGQPGNRHYRRVGHVEFLGQALTMAVSPGRHVVNQIEVGLPSIVLISGFLLAIFSAAAVFAMQEAQRHAQSLDRMNAGLENLVLARTSALQEERERWRVTLMSIGDGVIVTDTAARVLALNGEAERLTGYGADEAFGKDVASVLPLYEDLQGPRVQGPVSDVLQSGEIQYLKTPVVLKARDGRVLYVNDSAAPIRNENGAVTGAVMVFRDVTQRRLLEEQAMKAKSLESLGVLAGGIAHDFNNILTAVFGNITLAKIYAPADESLQGALADAERASWRARELTFQLLTFAKGGAPIKKPGSIGETVRDLSVFFVKGSAVRCELLVPEVLWTVDFDPDQMGQVIQNIVLNAKEAMRGAGVLKIQARNATLAESEVSDLAAGDYVEIAFQDNGCGIEKQHLERIFDPYFSLKPTGTGLGLAVTYSVVKRHQGTVVARSVVGEGTELTVYLPRSENTDYRQAARLSAREIPAAGAGRRILLMDDDVDVRTTGARLLRTLGYFVAEASNGEEVLRLYKQSLSGNPYEAVILDLTVAGGMGGKECVHALRECDAGVRAIVATGYYTDPIMAEFRSYGFVAAVQKPYRLEELSDTLTEVLAL